jgi:hypothetical protein
MKQYTWYKLVGKIPQLDETNGGWFKKNRSKTKIETTKISPTTTVITVFLCLSSSTEKIPLLFETCVMIKEKPEFSKKFKTYNEAIAEHKKIVKELKKI